MAVDRSINRLDKIAPGSALAPADDLQRWTAARKAAVVIEESRTGYHPAERQGAADLPRESAS